MPSPTETLLRVQASPVPTQIVLGDCGSTVIAPMDSTGSLSNTGLNVVPPLVDFQTPPLAAPTYTVSRPFSRSEEHTSELQSLTNLVCRLLLEKKKKQKDKKNDKKEHKKKTQKKTANSERNNKTATTETSPTEKAKPRRVSSSTRTGVYNTCRQ